MTPGHFLREGIAAEQHRLAVLEEVARMQSIAEAQIAGKGDGRPFAAPGSFHVFLRRHIATGRFRPATIQPTTAISR